MVQNSKKIYSLIGPEIFQIHLHYCGCF